jgi:putative membrane protein
MMGYGFMSMGGWLWMLLFWGGVIVLSIWLISQLFPSTRKQNKEFDAPRSAQEILDIRYARGELTQEEYQRMSQNLQGVKQ